MIETGKNRRIVVERSSDTIARGAKVGESGGNRYTKGESFDRRDRAAILLWRLYIMFLLLLMAMKIGVPEASTLADIGAAADFKLVDTNGHEIALESFRGKAVLVSFVYTTCTGTCPMTTLALTRVRDKLEKAGIWGEGVEFVSITLDPDRDDVEALKRYAEMYKIDTSRWHFLSGDPAEVKKSLADWGMWVKRDRTGVLDHPSRVFLVDPRGRIREIYNLEFLKPAWVVDDVRTVLGEKSNRSTDEKNRPARIDR